VVHLLMLVGRGLLVVVVLLHVVLQQLLVLVGGQMLLLVGRRLRLWILVLVLLFVCGAL
jgi:hypothetical protein